VRILTHTKVVAYAAQNASAATSLATWSKLTRAAQWTCSGDVSRTFPSSTVLNGERVVFKIAGNAFRLIAAIHYPSRGVWIKFIGTHAEYDKIDAISVDQYRNPKS
jgi:mRNA interferase HigB